MPSDAASGGYRGIRRSKPKRKPSATQRARAQEQQYASQGRSVERQANRQRRAAKTKQRPSRRPVAFRPLPQRTQPFKVQRQRQGRQHERARRDLPDSTAIPHIPLKKRYTERERTVIRNLYRKGAEKTGGSSILDLYALGSKRQREQMRRVSDRVRRSEVPLIRRSAYRHPGFQPSPGRRKVGGLIPAATIESRLMIPGLAGGSTIRLDQALRKAGLPIEASYNLGRAFVEEPGRTSKSSLRTLRESITGIPQAVKMIASATKKGVTEGDWSEAETVLDQIAQDYEDRYGSALEGDWETFRKRVQEDYGLTPYALDAAAVAGGVGQGAGAVARTSAIAHLGNLPGRAGRVAKVINEASRKDVARPRLRFAAGEGGTRAQRVSRNLFVATGQRGLDRRRAARYRAEVRRAGFEEQPSGEMLRTRRGAEAGRLPGLRPGPGEVLGRGLRDTGPLRGLTGRIQRDIGGTKSVTRLQMLTHRGRVMKQVNKVVDPLDDAEQVGLALALKYGIKNDPRALARLQQRLDEIESPENRKAREEGGFDDSMEADAIRAILDDPDAYLTPRVRDAAGQLRAIQKRESARDPSLADEQEVLRRYSQQAELLGVEKRRTRKGELAPDTIELERLVGMLEDTGRQQRKAGQKVTGQAQLNALRTRIEEIKSGADPDVERRVDVSGAGMAQAVARAYSGPERRGESDIEGFVQRVDDAAREAGLDEPAYWMSVADPESGARFAAVGSGLKATERNKEYTGGLFRIGAEDVGLDVFVRGVERNIKRRFQWQMVARNIETHAFEWSRNDGQGITASEANNLMRKRKILKESVDLIPATIVRKRDPIEEGLTRGRPINELPEGEEFGEVLDELRKRETLDSAYAKELTNAEVQGAPMFRYFVVPKEVTEVLEAAARPSSGAARTFEIVMKQKPTRLMLGALNIPWLGFQVASNTMLTGLGGGLKPWDIYGASKWFRGLDDDAKLAIEAELGITHGHHFALDQPHMGDAKVPFGVKHLRDFYRGYKQTKVGRGLHKANPLDFMFRLDEAQNNFFRKTLFYSQAKKDVYRSMGRNWRGIDDAQRTAVEKVFNLPPHEQMKAIAENADLFEKHAKHVNDWLGNYTKFSSAERKMLQANVLFYGYLRFSLRFAFYTMPVQHPIMLNILGNMGRMGAQEIKDIFGVPSNYSLPTSMLAQVYYGDHRDAKKGTLRSINWGRMNPFLNAVTQLEAEQQAVGLVSPIYQALADQAFEESSFTGREWRIEGRPTPGEAERPRNYFGSALNLLNPGAYAIPGVTEGKPRNRILQASLARMAFPYRVAAETGIPGVVDPLAESSSDDALLGVPRPMRYKDEEAMAGVRRSRRIARETPFAEKLLGQILPPLQSRPTAAPQVIERELEKEADQRNRSTGKKKKRKRTTNHYGGSSSNRYGGSSSNRYGG